MIVRLVVIRIRSTHHQGRFPWVHISTPITHAQALWLAAMFNSVMEPIIKQMEAVKSLTFTIQDVDINK